MVSPKNIALEKIAIRMTMESIEAYFMVQSIKSIDSKQTHFYQGQYQAYYQMAKEVVNEIIDMDYRVKVINEIMAIRKKYKLK